MATIFIDDSRPFPVIPEQPDNRRESAQDFFKRQAADLKLISDEMEQESKEQEELRKLQEKSLERKKKLLFDNLDLIMRYRDEIFATPRYANIDAHYAIKGGGLYVGPLSTSRAFNIAGSIVRVNLRLVTLLRIWETDQFRVDCKCGSTALIRSFGNYFWFLQKKLSEDVETVARHFIGKWTLAEMEYEKKVGEGKYKDPKPGDDFHGDGTPCNLETMINELRLKEFEEVGTR